jgi:ABC-type lipoprotein release transport system permease subunit
MLVPLSIAVLMFDRAQVGFLVGLPIGLALLAANWRPAFQRVNPTGAVLLMSLAGLAAVQFTPLVAALALRPRWERAAVVLVFALLLALAAAVSAWRGRRAGQQKVRPA